MKHAQLDHEFVSDNLEHLQPICYFPNNYEDMQKTAKCFKMVMDNYDDYRDILITEFKHCVDLVDKGQRLDTNVCIHIFAIYAFSIRDGLSIFDDLIRILSWEDKKYSFFKSNYLQTEVIICAAFAIQYEKKLLDIVSDSSVASNNRARIVAAFPYLIKHDLMSESKVTKVLCQILNDIFNLPVKDIENHNDLLRVSFSAVLTLNIEELLPIVIKFYKQHQDITDLFYFDNIEDFLKTFDDEPQIDCDMYIATVGNRLDVFSDVLFGRPFFSEDDVEKSLEALAGLSALVQLAMLEEDLPRPAPRTSDKTPRNSKCPCGSGKKYKKCCLNKNED